MQVILNGNTYSDDGTATRDMTNGGHRTWLLAMISDLLVVLSGVLLGSTNTKIVTATGSQSVGQYDLLTVWRPGTPAAVNFQLPSSPSVGQTHEFKYDYYSGQLYAMTVTMPAGHTVDNAAGSVATSEPGGTVKFTYTGSSKWVQR